jgi:vacuolar-type H+-ATPase subunit F/Vma7
MGMKLVLIGDELTAVGWRLAGAQVDTPGPKAAAESLRAALVDSDVVLITAELAAHVPAEQLSAALQDSHPLVLVIPDLRHQREPPDLADQVHHALGIML